MSLQKLIEGTLGINIAMNWKLYKYPSLTKVWKNSKLLYSIFNSELTYIYTVHISYVLEACKCKPK